MRVIAKFWYDVSLEISGKKMRLDTETSGPQITHIDVYAVDHRSEHRKTNSEEVKDCILS